LARGDSPCPADGFPPCVACSMSGPGQRRKSLKELQPHLQGRVSRAALRRFSALARNNCPRAKFRCGCLLRHPAKDHETDVDLAAASGAAASWGFQHPPWPQGPEGGRLPTASDVRDYEVIYKLLEDIQSAMEGLTRARDGGGTLGEAECGPFSVSARQAVCPAVKHSTSRQAQRNCKGPGCIAPKQVRLRWATSRLLPSQQGQRPKRWPRFSKCGHRLLRIVSPTGKQGSRRGLTSWSPSRRTLSTN